MNRIIIQFISLLISLIKIKMNVDDRIKSFGTLDTNYHLRHIIIRI